MRHILHHEQVCFFLKVLVIALAGPLCCLSDMLGFKLETSLREGSFKEKIRPIYLDMQVRWIIFSGSRVLIMFRLQLQ